MQIWKENLRLWATYFLSCRESCDSLSDYTIAVCWLGSLQISLCLLWCSPRFTAVLFILFSIKNLTVNSTSMFLLQVRFYFSFLLNFQQSASSICNPDATYQFSPDTIHRIIGNICQWNHTNLVFQPLHMLVKHYHNLNMTSFQIEPSMCSQMLGHPIIEDLNLSK